MPEPTTVWMVHLGLGEPVEVRGTLQIDDDALVFAARGSDARTRFPLERVRRARRLMISPVMMVDWTDDDRRRKTAFYFAQPPPLKPAETSMPGYTEEGRPASPFGQLGSGARRRKRNNTTYLSSKGVTLKPVIRAWVSEVNQRITRGTGSS
jgi:hypothetical protein